MASKTLLFYTVLIVCITISRSQWPYHDVYPPVEANDDRTPLYFAVVLSNGGERVSIGALPGVQIALDHVNSNPSLLPGYTLHYTLTPSQCDRESALKAYFDQMKNPPTKLGWVGSGCSIATEPTAELTHFYNITQLSCVSSSPVLQDRERFRYYFQLLATNLLPVHGFYGIIRHFDWRRVRLITQDEQLYTGTMDALKKMLDASEDIIEYTEVRFRSSEGFSSVKTFDSEIRIYVLAMYSKHALDALCQAYRGGYHYPRYTIITFGWYVEGWWKVNPSLSNCTAEERAQVLEYSLAAVPSQFPREEDSFTAEPNITLSGFHQLYNAAVEEDEILVVYKNNIFPYAHQCNEATLAFAYALNRTMADLAENETLNREAAEQSDVIPAGQKFTMDNFTYANSVVVSRMFEHLKNTNFPGITGNKVTFNDVGTRQVDRVRILQYQRNSDDLKRVEVGAVVDIEGNNTFQTNNDTFIYPDGIPIDGVPNEKVVTVSIGLSVVYIFLATVGLGFTVFCICFTITFRNKRIIRLASPNLNYMICAGAIVFYLNAIALVIPTTDAYFAAVLCNIDPWLISLGFSLCYGVIIIKMIRIWYIFNRPFGFKAGLFRDHYMALYVLLLVVIDVAILLTHVITEGIRDNLGVHLSRNRELPEETLGVTGVKYEYFVYVCESEGQEILYGVLFGYKGLLQAVALLLAFRTRNVKVKGLDDSLYIAASVYVTSIVLAVIIVSTYTLKDYVNTYPAVVGLGLLLGTSVILGLVFIPRMIGLYRDPQGEKVGTMATSDMTGKTEDFGSNKESELKKLRQRVTELETLVKQNGKEISTSMPEKCDKKDT